MQGCVNEGVCEIVDPDAVLGKGELVVEKPNTVVKLIESEKVRDCLKCP